MSRNKPSVGQLMLRVAFWSMLATTIVLLALYYGELQQPLPDWATTEDPVVLVVGAGIMMLIVLVLDWVVGRSRRNRRR